ncbi:YjcZ family sporulation protein [Paenibacillus alba]|uniref:YjcZ family sporulation protein n=1 Tax=Paenibacillus alba TaxID=1197127 RepID=A0ABU6GIQ6_9BACL|nr:YjcZ family sporulation protein [Paenibacillus alba]MEC0232603.1 YjcZ family sporulation protein [Paenibacillus alba]
MGYEAGGVGYGMTSAAGILVLFILLVIISVAFAW